MHMLVSGAKEAWIMKNGTVIGIFSVPATRSFREFAAAEFLHQSDFRDGVSRRRQESPWQAA